MGTKIYNSSLTRELVDVAKIQNSTDPTPSELADKVIAVIDVNPKHARIADIIKSTARQSSGNSTIYTTPSSGQDFYLTSIAISLQTDATNDGTAFQSTATVGGVSVVLADLRKITLTATSYIMVIPFPIPIKIDRGSTITIGGTYTAGSANISASITGYLISNVNA